MRSTVRTRTTRKASHDVGLFRRGQEDDETPERVPLDDARDFNLSDGQRRARNLTDTKEQMKRVHDEMFGPNSELAKYAAKLRYVRVRRER